VNTVGKNYYDVISLVDAYNLLCSDRVNDKEALVDSLLILYGVSLTDEQIQKSREQRTISVPPKTKGTEVTYVTKDINEDQLEILKKAIVDDIHKISMTPNMTDENFVGNSSGVAIRFKLLPFELNVQDKQTAFERGLMERMRLYNKYFNKTGKLKMLPIHNVDAVFKRSLPQNDFETSQMILNLMGKVSDESLIAQLSFVQDASAELEKRRREIGAMLSSVNTESLKTSNYWINRSAERLASSERYAISTLAQLSDVFTEAQQNIKREIDSLYKNYAVKGVLERSALESALSPNERASFLRQVQIKAQELGLNPAEVYDERYLWRLSRLDALNKQIELEIASIGQQEERITTRHYRDVIENAYGRSQEDVLDQYNISPMFTTLSEDMIRAIVESKWAGRHFSESIWQNKDKLMQELPKLLSSSMLSGQGVMKTSRILRDRMDVGFFDAKRLVATETNYMHGQGELQSYVDDGIEQYEYVAILDSRTSDICKRLDGEIVNLEDAQVGENYPPMHPFCRSTTVAYFEGSTLRRKRSVDLESLGYRDLQELAQKYDIRANQSTEVLRTELSQEIQFPADYRRQRLEAKDSENVEKQRVLEKVKAN